MIYGNYNGELIVQDAWMTELKRQYELRIKAKPFSAKHAGHMSPKSQAQDRTILSRIFALGTSQAHLDPETVSQYSLLCLTPPKAVCVKRIGCLRG